MSQAPAEQDDASADDASADDASADEANGEDYRGSKLVSRGGIAVFGAQFAVLMAYSWVQYHRFNLGIDFASVNQAATEIGRGNLNPYPSVLIPSSSFLDNHFAVILWPIAALMLVIRTPFLFLVVQNVFLVGSGFITFKWASDVVVSRKIEKSFAFGILALAAALLLFNPLVYYSAALDFHFEAIATFFAIFAAYDLWSGRFRRAWIWVGLCLLCGDLGGLYIAGVGISALLAGKATRRIGLWYVLLGVVWVGFIGAIHANQGSLLDNYAYLAGRSTLPTGFKGAVVVLGGLMAHPLRAYDALRSKARMIWRFLPPGGVIGIVTPWGFGVPAIVLLSSALQSNTLFIGEPFQQFAVVPFVLIGTVSLLSALIASDVHLYVLSGRAWTRRWSQNRAARWIVAGVLMFGILVAGARYVHEYLPGSFTDNASADILPAAEGSALSTALARTPSDAEVISSIDVAGRFSARQYAYIYLNATTSVPIRSRTVELVMDTAHDPFVTPMQQQAAAQYLASRFGARTLLHRNDVWELGWSAPSTDSSITMP